MISGFSQNALNQLQGALGGGGSVTTVVIDFERLANEVARLNATASQIAQAVSNPTWAAGDELCRRAALALENQWFDAAAQDARHSIDAYPYRAAPYLFLALACLHQGDSTTAYGSLLKAIEFGKAAEPSHAATAGLLAANLAAGAGRADMASTILLKAREATKSRCPALVVATQQANPTNSADLCQLLKDDPAAWADVPAPDPMFGADGAEFRAAFNSLLEAVARLVMDAEEFTRKTTQLTRSDVSFLERVYDSGSSRYSGSIEALEQYRGGGTMRMLSPYVRSVLNARPNLSLAVAVSVGHQILRYMAWRSPTRVPLHDDWLNLTFDLASFKDSLRTNPEPDVLGSGPVLDVLITDWYTIDLDVRMHDLPRKAGQTRGTGPYLRTLRAHDKFRRDANDLNQKMAHLEATPEPRGIRDRAYQQQRYEASRQEIAIIERFLATPPPELPQVQQSIAHWVKITAPTAEPVVRPYAHISSPFQAMVNSCQ